MTRHVFSMIGALALVWLLFATMYWAIRPPAQNLAERDLIEDVEVLPPEPPEPEDQQQQLESAPPPPPSAPPSLARPDLPSVSIPVPAVSVSGNIAVPMNLGGGSSLAGSGFGGFAGSGAGGGGDGYARGQGFDGRELIPLSTARPQMPEWACKQKIKGWVEVVFTVLPNGRVQDVKIVDAQPRGVYEAAAIESISNWIYQSHSRAREVKQRVPMDPEECVYNWR